MRVSVPVISLGIALFAGNWAARGQTGPASFSALASAAQAARDADDLDKAIELYRKALKLRPTWEDGLWNLGSLTYDQNRYRECIAPFAKLKELKPDSAAVWTMSGLCQFGFYNYGSALDDFARVEQLGFNEALELAHVGRLDYALTLIKTGNFERAISILTAMDRNGSDLIVAAGIAGLRKRWLPAEVPESERDLVYKLGDAMASGMEQDYSAANRKFAEILQTHPSDANVQFRYGAMLYVQDPDRGMAEIQKAIALAPDHVPALVSMSAILLKRADNPGALRYAELAIHASPQDPAAHIVLGRALLTSGDLTRAVSELQQAVKLGPGLPEAHYSLASALTRMGKKEEAARELAEFKRLEHPAEAKKVP